MEEQLSYPPLSRYLPNTYPNTLELRKIIVEFDRLSRLIIESHGNVRLAGRYGHDMKDDSAEHLFLIFASAMHHNGVARGLFSNMSMAEFLLRLVGRIPTSDQPNFYSIQKKDWSDLFRREISGRVSLSAMHTQGYMEDDSVSIETLSLTQHGFTRLRDDFYEEWNANPMQPRRGVVSRNGMIRWEDENEVAAVQDGRMQAVDDEEVREEKKDENEEAAVLDGMPKLPANDQLVNEMGKLSGDAFYSLE